MRGNGKELKEAKRFLEAFGIDDDESVDAVRRCSNMLREAKGNGKIGGIGLDVSDEEAEACLRASTQKERREYARLDDEHRKGL